MMRSLLIAVAITSAADPAPTDLAETVRRETTILASDAMEGREAGTPGYDRAARHVAAAFADAGLEPLGSLGGWFQHVPLRMRTLGPAEPRSTLIRPGGRDTLVNGIDIAFDASPDEARQSMEAPLVFVGYGVEAPRQGHDDYAGLDVRGRIVVVLEGAPAFLPSTLRAHYGWPEQKERLAEAHGAIGIITLKPPARERVSPWDRTRRLRPGPQLGWVRPDGVGYLAAPGIRFSATLGPEAAERLFAGSGTTRDDVYAEAEARAPRGRPLAARFAIERQSSWQELASANVVGLLRGADQSVADEIIVVMGHLDGLGRGAAVDGDTIYNGASDNAVGVAAMIALAQELSRGPRPRRSIMFVATTAEEKGLLGSEYFAAHPPVPIDRLRGVINIDGLPAFHDVGGVIAYGAEHSTFGALASEAAARSELRLEADAAPEQGIFTRSDHYPLVKAGVPGIFVLPGYGPDRTGTRSGRDMWDWFFANRYHRPNDDMTLPWNWDAVARLTHFHLELTRAVANAARAPAWQPGDLFGELYALERQQSERTSGRQQR